jgi:hypothetical protein
MKYFEPHFFLITSGLIKEKDLLWFFNCTLFNTSVVCVCTRACVCKINSLLQENLSYSRFSTWNGSKPWSKRGTHLWMWVIIDKRWAGVRVQCRWQVVVQCSICSSCSCSNSLQFMGCSGTQVVWVLSQWRCFYL